VFEPHLALSEITLAAGAEWMIKSPGWCFLLVSSGVAYWLHPRSNHELCAGSALLFSDRAEGVLRASQLGEVSFRFFRVNPDRLTGLVTWGEQQVLERAATQETFATRSFAPGAPVAHAFKVACGRLNGSSLPLRLKLLDLFLQALTEEIWQRQTSPDSMPDARVRLIKLLNETPAAELLELSFGDLVRQVRCTPRHLSRIFRELVGVSFREKQARLRLLRAQELLATSQSKIVEVALESGYQSLSLFNVMFKRRFGLTPAKWRNHTRQRHPTPGLERRLRG